ncbi:peptidylprolyl isomerase [Amycolatopsis sp.]|uniref:peptidylprolyl isomerase n=1 Tax=Amycolatopsis sp. TaxID=37632 RepID=UPI002E0ACB68|nr:peptidyl-prolyl cis-trans isomerase [Amycolatopsis sp.]
MKIAPYRDAAVRLATRFLSLPPAGSWSQRISVAALAVLAAGSTANIVIDRVTALPSDAVYRTSGEVMTTKVFDNRLHLLSAMYGVQVPQDQTAKDKFNRDAAKAIAVTDLVDAAAKERNVAVADKAAQDQLDTVIQQSPGGRDAFVSQLGTLGLSQGDVLAEVKRTIASSQLFDQITGKVPATTDQEIQQYYGTHTADMAMPEARHIRNVVVADQAAAQDVFKQAKAGADLGQLATQKSLDQSTRDKGGDLGSVSAVQLESGYASAAFGVPQGGLFGPVQTQFGWNVGQVLEITPAEPRTLAEVHDQLKSEMQLSAKLGVWRSWLTDRIKGAAVEYADNYRPADPDSPPADLTPR